MSEQIEAILREIVPARDVESAVVVVPDGSNGGVSIAASVGLPEVAVAGLAAAMRDPDHPVVRTVREPVAAFDVLPTRPGGPELRAHVPLTLTRDGHAEVVGALALAYQRSLGDVARSEIEAAAARIAEAIDGGR